MKEVERPLNYQKKKRGHFSGLLGKTRVQLPDRVQEPRKKKKRGVNGPKRNRRQKREDQSETSALKKKGKRHKKKKKEWVRGNKFNARGMWGGPAITKPMGKEWVNRQKEKEGYRTWNLC